MNWAEAPQRPQNQEASQSDFSLHTEHCASLRHPDEWRLTEVRGLPSSIHLQHKPTRLRSGYAIYQKVVLPHDVPV